MTTGTELTDIDRTHLREAMRLAERGRVGARPNPIVGAILAVGTRVLATGYHARYGERHAERVALDAWGNEPVPSDATLYVSLEPCSHEGRQPPCVAAILKRGVRRVAIAGADPSEKTAGIGPRQLAEAGVEVVWGDEQIAAAAAQQNAGFVSVHTRGRPYTTCKWAMTRNGRFATGDPRRRWISGEASRMRVQLMRAASGAVVVGIDTVLVDDPRLTVRGPAAAGMFQQPLRTVLDRSLRMPLDAQLVQTAVPVPTLVVTTAKADPSIESALCAYGIDVWRAPEDVDFLYATWAELAARGVNDILLECGPRLATACWEAGLIDVLACFTAPFSARDDLPGLDADNPLRVALEGVTPVRSGEDLLTRLTVNPIPPVPIPE